MSRRTPPSSSLWLLPLVLILLLSCQRISDSLQSAANGGKPEDNQAAPSPTTAPLPELSFAVQICLLLAMFLLAGCFGLGIEFWGTIESDIAFTELEFLGGDAVPVVADGLPAEAPLWHMRGTADYTVDWNLTVYDDEAVASAVDCTGTATYNVEAQIFKDIVLDF